MMQNKTTVELVRIIRGLGAPLAEGTLRGLDKRELLTMHKRLTLRCTLRRDGQWERWGRLLTDEELADVEAEQELWDAGYICFRGEGAGGADKWVHPVQAPGGLAFAAALAAVRLNRRLS